MIFDTLDNFNSAQVLYTCNHNPLGGPHCSVKHSQSLEMTLTPSLLEHGDITVPQLTSIIGISIMQLLCDGCLTLSYPAAHPFINQSSHSSPFLLYVTVLHFLSWSHSLLKKHVFAHQTSNSLSYPVSDSVS